MFNVLQFNLVTVLLESLRISLISFDYFPLRIEDSWRFDAPAGGVWRVKTAYMFSESGARRVRLRCITVIAFIAVEAELMLCSMSLEITPPVKFFMADIARVAL